MAVKPSGRTVSQKLPRFSQQLRTVKFTKEKNMHEKTSGGMGFSGALTLFFIGLKLMYYITRRWWRIPAPTWIPIAPILLFAAFVVTIENTCRRAEVPA